MMYNMCKSHQESRKYRSLSKTAADHHSLSLTEITREALSAYADHAGPEIHVDSAVARNFIGFYGRKGGSRAPCVIQTSD